MPRKRTGDKRAIRVRSWRSITQQWPCHVARVAAIRGAGSTRLVASSALQLQAGSGCTPLYTVVPLAALSGSRPVSSTSRQLRSYSQRQGDDGDRPPSYREYRRTDLYSSLHLVVVRALLEISEQTNDPEASNGAMGDSKRSRNSWGSLARPSCLLNWATK